MIPHTMYASALSESAGTAITNADTEDTVNTHSTQVESQHGSNTDMETYSHILNRIPSASRQWKSYIHDAMTDRARRAQRVRNVQENPEAFLRRFPIE